MVGREQSPLAAPATPAEQSTLHAVVALEPSSAIPYRSSTEHLLSELERIDLLIEAQVTRARQVQARDELPGLYISEQEVDALLAQPIGMPRWAALPAAGIAADLEAAL